MASECCTMFSRIASLCSEPPALLYLYEIFWKIIMEVLQRGWNSGMLPCSLQNLKNHSTPKPFPSFSFPTAFSFLWFFMIFPHGLARRIFCFLKVLHDGLVCLDNQNFRFASTEWKFISLLAVSSRRNGRAPIVSTKPSLLKQSVGSVEAKRKFQLKFLS